MDAGWITPTRRGDVPWLGGALVTVLSKVQPDGVNDALAAAAQEVFINSCGAVYIEYILTG
jgi:hypothetical protein